MNDSNLFFSFLAHLLCKGVACTIQEEDMYVYQDDYN